MNDRIKWLREELIMTQDELARSLGLSRNYISLVENGQRNLSDQSTRLLCKLYNINEQWLKTGFGNMYNDNQQLESFFDFVKELPGTEFKRRVVDKLASMNDKEWFFLEKLITDLSAEKDYQKVL